MLMLKKGDFQCHCERASGRLLKVRLTEKSGVNSHKESTSGFFFLEMMT